MEPNEAVRAGIYAGLIDKNSIYLEQYRPHRLLFLAHREQHLNQAMASFARVLGKPFNCGKLTGGHQQYGCPFYFQRFKPFLKMGSSMPSNPASSTILLSMKVTAPGPTPIKKF